MWRYLCLAFFLVYPTCAMADAQAPAPGTWMLCTAEGQEIYIHNNALVCGSPNPASLAAIVLSGGAAPTIAAGSGAGTSPTVAVTGAENSQIVTLTTTCTVTCTGSAIIATVTLPLSCPTQALPTITPGNLNAAQLSGSGQVYPTETVNTYVLHSSSTGLVASTQYIWNVHVDCW